MSNLKKFEQIELQAKQLNYFLGSNKSNINQDFHKMQLGRGGECLACKGGSLTMNQTPQQPLIGMIFTNADPRYAGRLDDKQGGDTIVTMKRVREAIAFNAELVDESTWLWFTSEQMGFLLRPTGGGEHEERAEDLDSSQGVRDSCILLGACDH